MVVGSILQEQIHNLSECHLRKQSENYNSGFLAHTHTHTHTQTYGGLRCFGLMCFAFPRVKNSWIRPSFQRCHRPKHRSFM
uniref:Uncharacterized protein n=1 Tax=Anguilla anguilla TaxID=7936 RepID=A0A0E9TYT5_ANGAN